MRAVRPTGGTGMAVQLHGRGRRRLRHRGPAEAAAHQRHPRWQQRLLLGAQNAAGSGRGLSDAAARHVPAGGTGPCQGPQQAVSRRAGQLVVTPAGPPAHPCLAAVPGVDGHLAGGVRRLGAGVPHHQEAVEAIVVQEEGRASAGGALERGTGGAAVGGLGRRAALPSLRDGQDAAVEVGAHGPQDAVQRVRGALQVGPPGAGVPARGKPDLHHVQALQLPPQGAGAAPPEGDAAPDAGCAADAASPPQPGAARDRRRDDAHAGALLHAVRWACRAAHHGGRRLPGPPPPRARLPAAHLDESCSMLELIN